MIKKFNISKMKNCHCVVPTGPIDCETDPCHLAWLIRDNRQLLPAVFLANCANGTSFQDLNVDEYSIICPVKQHLLHKFNQFYKLFQIIYARKQIRHQKLLRLRYLLRQHHRAVE